MIKTSTLRYVHYIIFKTEVDPKIYFWVDPM